MIDRYLAQPVQICADKRCFTGAGFREKRVSLAVESEHQQCKEENPGGNDAQSVNKPYSKKIAQLEGEAEQAKSKLTEAQRQLQEPENKELRDLVHKAKLQRDFRKKTEEAKLKMQCKQNSRTPRSSSCSLLRKKSE
ncbi:kinesin-like protein KIF27 [Xenopus laevis]|uniref:Kinesin-like protein KIF27 n=1 Tax=Xenopus laevis TaxID=8355 RepID=A0A8J1LLT1_XENLA|nr:kinesin-like protein KIF27 [Xenopus laevis]